MRRLTWRYFWRYLCAVFSGSILAKTKLRRSAPRCGSAPHLIISPNHHDHRPPRQRPALPPPRRRGRRALLPPVLLPCIPRRDRFVARAPPGGAPKEGGRRRIPRRRRRTDAPAGRRAEDVIRPFLPLAGRRLMDDASLQIVLAGRRWTETRLYSPRGAVRPTLFQRRRRCQKCRLNPG